MTAVRMHLPAWEVAGIRERAEWLGLPARERWTTPPPESLPGYWPERIVAAVAGWRLLRDGRL